MASRSSFPFLPASIALLLLLSFLAGSQQQEQQQPELASTYIVYVSKSLKPASFASLSDWYRSALASAKGLHLEQLDAQEEGPMYAYDTVFHGFAAKLTPRAAEALQQMEGVLASIPDAPMQLHTTRTPAFLGLSNTNGLWPASNYGDDVIIGVMDSGVWPERRSFDDTGLQPVPARWKGLCETTTDFGPSLCNKKLVGARSFYKGYEAAAGPINETVEYRSPRDSDGHGTHTSSTAAGNFVADASLLGSASGTARGIATRARIAMYKVCWKGGCYNSDMLAAFDQAVTDGVNIISVSIGGGVVPYFLDPIAIGSFGAMENGVLVSTSAGNGGPSPQSVTNVAPWLLTVAASTLDRDFPSPVKLGNGMTFKGESLYDGKALGDRQVPLIYAGNAGLPDMNGSANLCIAGSLAPALVKGKIVVCDRGLSARAAKGMVVSQAGGVGMILANAAENGDELIADSHVLPATIVSYESGVAIKAYIAESPHPTASLIFSGTVLGVKPAPVIAAFSSRGPNPGNPEILKPDVTAPGVNILAAWTGKTGPSEQPGDNRVVEFNILSGTSMSCPHVSGLTALLKGAHPKWSPAAIKSALMTTASDLDNTGKILMDSDSNSSTPFMYGSGHVNPVRALSPGLVYDLGIQDYVDFLCGLNYSSKLLMTFTKDQHQCSKGSLGPGDLNYPSLSFVYNQDGTSSRYVSTTSRTVTNVGTSNSKYFLATIAPPGVAMKVEPTTLSFTRLYEKQSYKVTVEASSHNLQLGEIDSSFGSLVWSDGTHKVYSPVAFTWQSAGF